MRPFPCAIGWFWIHGVKILPGRSPFRVERPEIMHSAKMLPGLLGLQCRHKKGSPNGDPSNKFFGSTQRLPDAYNLCTKRTNLGLPIWGGDYASGRTEGAGRRRAFPSEGTTPTERACGLLPEGIKPSERTWGFQPEGITPDERTCACQPG